MAIVDIELESQILGGMVNGQECLEIAIAELMNENFTGVYKDVFSTIRKMYENTQKVDDITVYAEIKHEIRASGITWTSISSNYIAPGQMPFLCQKLREVTASRQLAEFGQTLMQKVRDNVSSADIQLWMEKAVYAFNTATEVDQVVNPQEQACRILDTVARRMDPELRSRSSTYTSMKRLNQATGGFEAGDLVIVSGPTGGGKTAFSMGLAKDICIVQRLPGAYINTEMSAEQMDLRLAAMLSNDLAVTNTALRTGSISDSQYQDLVIELDKINSSSLYQARIPNLTIPKMLTTIRRFSMQQKVRVVWVDYIGRCDFDNATKEDWQVLTGAARKLKTIAQELGIVVFMLAQVNADGKLAQAKYMEHECDLHLHIRPMTDHEKGDCLSRLETCWNYVISIEKGRNAPKGIIPVRFVGEKLQFVADKEEADKYAKLAGSTPLFTGNSRSTERKRRNSA